MIIIYEGRRFMNKEVKLLLKTLKIPIVDEDRNYWLVRTNEGEYFQDFYFDNFIAIGFDAIPLNKICQDQYLEMKQAIREYYPEYANPDLIVNQLVEFVHHMKKGDIVLLPSLNYAYIVIGELLDDEMYLLNKVQSMEWAREKRCPYIKRRRVKWYKYIKIEELDVYLHSLLNIEQLVSNINDYASFIDRTLYSFYIKGDKAYSVFQVNKDYNIPALELSSLIYNIVSMVDKINELSDEEFNLNKKEINVKINVQSSGPIELSGVIETLVWVTVILIGIFGGEINFIHLFQFKTDGLIGAAKKIIELLKNDKEDKWKEQMSYLLKELKVELPRIRRIKRPEIDNEEKKEVLD